MGGSNLLARGFLRSFNSAEPIGSLLTPLDGQWLQQGSQSVYLGLPPIEDRFNNIGRQQRQTLAGQASMLGQVETLLADNGYFSAANVTTCEATNIVPLIATGREVHHPSLAERFAAVPTGRRISPRFRPWRTG